MPFKSSARGAYGPQGQKVIKGPLAPVWVSFNPPDATASAYSYQFVATDDSGDTPTYSLASGSLPNGLTLSSSGLLTGTCTVAGTFVFNVRATDVNGRFTDSGNIDIAVALATANGGTVTTNGAYTIHTFTTTGTFEVLNASKSMEVLIVAGGGGSGGTGGSGGGGGGAGGVLYASSVTFPAQSYTATVGQGGQGQQNGGSSSIGSYVANGGGYGPGGTGGCGGGGPMANGSQAGQGGTNQGSNGPFTGYGSAGGPNGGSPYGGGGGGGAGAVGNQGHPQGNGQGGIGRQYSVSGTSTYYAGGGGGAIPCSNYGGSCFNPAGGQGGGGAGGFGSYENLIGTNGTNGLGGGAGGSTNSRGGNGIIIIRYLT